MVLTALSVILGKITTDIIVSEVKVLGAKGVDLAILAGTTVGFTILLGLLG